MNDKQLYKIWKKYINIPIFRSQSEEYNYDVKNFGLNPKKDPYKKVIKKIKKLLLLLIQLEKKGFIHEQDWGFKKVTGKYIAMVSSDDLNSPFIDFTPKFKEVLFYKKHNGGALTQTIKRITNDILLRKPKLSSKNFKLVNELNEWALHKSNYSNVILNVSGSSKAFEKALFQVKLGKEIQGKYLPSPFGRFSHFKKIIAKEGLEKYLPYLKENKLFYLRVTSKIPAREIRVLK